MHDVTVIAGTTQVPTADMMTPPFDYTRILWDQMSELLVYGRLRTHHNFMPEFVFFPRTQRALDGCARFGNRCRDAYSAFRYGFPDYEEWD